MFIPRIYTSQPLNVEEIIFDKNVSHYLTTVLRLKEGETVILFNGQSGEYQAQVHFQKKSASAKILSYQAINRESPLQLHLGQGLARGDRMDWVIQKATELGVASITPLITTHCGVKLKEDRLHTRLQHWQNITISAAEQCGRTQLPHIGDPILLKEWAQQPFQGSSLLFELETATSLKQLSTPQKQIRLAIGPESGWSPDEVQFLKNNHFVCYGLGPRILRTETAAIAVISILQGLLGDL